MDTVLHPLLVRVRSLRAFIPASLRKMLRIEAHNGDFASQRVCPFCGLITPRYETCCLECVKVLKPAESISHCTHNAERKVGVNRKVASRLTGTPLKTRVVVEVVTTFSSFRSPELSKPI